MDLYDFNRLNQEERDAAVMDKGTFIAARLSCGCTMCLYAMGKFFAEVVYLADDNQIILVRAFKSKFCLEPYLEMVDLSEIRM